MTLKEKFKNVDDEGKTWNQIYEQQEKIADDYAIEFAQWNLNLLLSGEEPKGESLEEGLEIFKKEKGL
jgi:hypothetical protein